MKRAVSLALAAVMLLSLSACGGGEKPQHSTELTSSAEISGEKSQQQSTEVRGNTDTKRSFEESKDLKVVAAFVYDGDTYAVLENTGEQAILNCRIAYINFDKNGFTTTKDSDGYERGKADTINLIPGQKDIFSWYGATGDYAVATVSAVDYADGTTWEMSGTDRWAESVKSEFSVEEQKALIEEMKASSALAETNEYASLTDCSIKHGNQFSSSHDLHFSIQNTSDQGIQTLTIFVLEFDENGFPVSVSPYDTYCSNGHRTGGKVNLAAGQSGDYTSDLFISSTTTQIKVVISSIEFQDGTEWENPNLYEWIIANNQNY